MLLLLLPLLFWMLTWMTGYDIYMARSAGQLEAEQLLGPHRINHILSLLPACDQA